MKIDYTQLQTFITCPRKYYNRYVLQLKKARYDERDIDKDFGSAVHAALEVLYKEHDLVKAKQCFREGFTGLETEKCKTPANGEILIEAYWNYWNKPVSDLSDTNLETVGVEVLDTVEIGQVQYLVKVDRIVKNNIGHWFMDHKTTTKLGNNYFYQFDPNMQFSGYAKYVTAKYGQCAGGIVDAIVVGHREKPYKGEPAGFHFKFVRDIVNRNKEQLADFEQNVIAWCGALGEALETNVWPKNEGSCHGFKGCAYKELCTSCDDQEIRETLYEKVDAYGYLKQEVKND